MSDTMMYIGIALVGFSLFYRILDLAMGYLALSKGYRVNSLKSLLPNLQWPSFFRRPSPRMRPAKLNELLALIPSNWDREDFILCGSACLAFRGIRDVHDLDILVRPGSNLNRDKQRDDLGAQGILDYGTERAWKLFKEIDLFEEVPRNPDLKFEDIKADADFIDGYYVQSPRHTLLIKLQIPKIRDKDRKDFVALAQLAAQPPTPKPEVVGDYRTGLAKIATITEAASKALDGQR